MFQFTKRLTSLAARNASVMLQYRGARYFCNQNKTLNPTYAKIREVYLGKGNKSKQYQEQMGKAMREALKKYDYPAAINLELFHLSLIKQSEGEKSDLYRTQIREITRFCINRLEFNTAAKLIQQLRQIQSSMPEIGPLDTISTFYLQGYIYMELNRLDDSKKCFQECLSMKQVQQAPEVFFKIYSEMARVHSRAGEREQALEKIKKCEQILSVRKFDPNSPPMLRVMHLQDVFHLAEIASGMMERQLGLKYIDIYKQLMSQTSNMKDPMYVEFLQRHSKVYFNLKQYEKSIELLNEAAQLSEELGKVDPNFAENATIMKNIAQSIKQEYMGK